MSCSACITLYQYVACMSCSACITLYQYVTRMSCSACVTLYQYVKCMSCSACVTLYQYITCMSCSACISLYKYVTWLFFQSVPVRDMTIFSKCSSPMNYKKKLITTGFYYNCHIISINNLILVRIYWRYNVLVVFSGTSYM